VVAKPSRPPLMTNAVSTASPRSDRGEAGRERGDRVLTMPPIVASEPLNPLRND
jgi:hypothetical protein